MKCNRRLLKCNLWRSDRHFTIFADSIYGYSNDCRSMFDRGYFSCFIHSRHTFLLVFHTGVVFDVDDTLSLYFSCLYNEILDGIRRTVGLYCHFTIHRCTVNLCSNRSCSRLLCCYFSIFTYRCNACLCRLPRHLMPGGWDCRKHCTFPIFQCQAGLI